MTAEGTLTELGRDLAERGILRRDESAQRECFEEGLRRVPVVLELMQGEWGTEIGRDQAEEVLKYLEPSTRSWQQQDFTRLFETLNFARLAAFNRKTGRLRIRNVSPAGHLAETGALISPATPYRNRRLAAELIRSARSDLSWFDSHFDRHALAFLYDEARWDRVKQVRILSCGRSELIAATLDEYRRLKAEVGARSVGIEWRTLLDREEFTTKHDRWLLADRKLWNVPPLSAVMQNKYGSLLPDANAVPLDDWWKSGVEVDKA